MRGARPVDRVVLVLSPSPVRRMLHEWLVRDGVDVREAAAWEVDGIVADGDTGVVLTSDDLDGEWEWSHRLGAEVVVLTLPRPTRV